MWIKICGTTNDKDARLAVELGADALGFIFAPSRRQVSPAQASGISRGLPFAVERVGVFTSGSADEIAAVVREAGLTAVQLHKPFQPELLRELRARLGGGLQLLQVVSLQIQPADSRAELDRFQRALQEALAHPELFAVLIDAARGHASGGLGVPFDWKAAYNSVEAARAYVLQRRGKAKPHIVLAGGLRPENVNDAIAAMSPWGVDVVSGVEASPGVKNPAKLRAFINGVRTHQT